MDLEAPLVYDPEAKAKADLYRTLDNFLALFLLITFIPVATAVWVAAVRYVF